VATRWLWKQVGSSMGEPKLTSLAVQGFAIGFVANALLEILLIIPDGSNTVLMTWNGQVVIEDGRRTFAGYVLSARGCIEGGVAGSVICTSIVLVARLIRREK
jgi:hypothetical protein